jgi:hypothetical protein
VRPEHRTPYDAVAGYTPTAAIGAGVSAVVIVVRGGLVGAAGLARFAFRLHRLSDRVDAEARELGRRRTGLEEPALSPWRRMLMLTTAAAPFLLLWVYLFGR